MKLIKPAKKFLFLAIGLISVVPNTFGQAIPEELWGKWVVRRVLPTTTMSCWGEPEARKMVGTEIEYSAQIFRWKNVITRNPIADSTIIGAKQFEDENSGGGANDSQVSFKQLGIKASQVKQIAIRHPVGNVTGATIEIPGDLVLVKDRNTIIFSTCSVYFEASRVTTSPHKNISP
jgi:hypothetical protein